ncbi:hypothetical protein [Maribacter sp. R77961]|uniref:hypothetical protein n=1 Tax=Maribacter sp. R77961 TaxID=3093871 RepID=UPI0037CC7952
MKPDQTINLVKGTFSPAEAADVLFSLISDKIKFHHLQILSLQNGVDNDMQWSEQRITSLKNSKNSAKDLILKARNEGYKLQIDGDITIKLIAINEQA